MAVRLKVPVYCSKSDVVEWTAKYIRQVRNGVVPNTKEGFNEMVRWAFPVMSYGSGLREDDDRKDTELYKLVEQRVNEWLEEDEM